MKFTGIKNFPLLELGLSQIYLNEAKIKAIESWFTPDDMSNFEPLPVRDFGDGRYTLTDGHTRAYVLLKNGFTQIPIIYDNDDIVAGELGQLLYREDIRWCERFGIRNIQDLSDRIVSDHDYRKYWDERCDRSYNLLTKLTMEELGNIQMQVPELFLYGASEDLAEFYFEDNCGKLFVYKEGKLNPEKE